MLYLKLTLAGIALAMVGADSSGLDPTAPSWIQAGAVAALATLSIMEQRATRKAIQDAQESSAKRDTEIITMVTLINDRQRRRLRIGDSDDPIDKRGV